MLPQFNFTFIVFQACPSRGMISYYVDGETSRRAMKIEDFLAIVQGITPDLVADAYKACQTYSFYLYNVADLKITHLTPRPGDDTLYPDNLVAVTHGKKPKLIAEKKSIEDTLAGYGFNIPTADSMKNLKVTLAPQQTERDGFISRMLARLHK